MRFTPENEKAAGRSLTEDGLHALLAALDQDSDQAADRYGRLHRRLTFYFAQRLFPSAESLADEVLDRVARRLLEGEPIQSVEAYSYGVARFVAQEETRRVVHEDEAKSEILRNRSLVPDTQDEEEIAAAVAGCLNHKEPDERKLLLSYYRSGGREQMDRRKQLAASLGMTSGALRNRVFRLKQEVEACARARLAAAKLKGEGR